MLEGQIQQSTGLEVLLFSVQIYLLQYPLFLQRAMDERENTSSQGVYLKPFSADP